MYMFTLLLVHILFQSVRPENVIIKFKKDATEKEIKYTLYSEGLTQVHKVLPSGYVLAKPTNESSTIAQELQNNFAAKSTELKTRHSKIEEITEDKKVDVFPRSRPRIPRAVTISDAMWSSMWYLQSSQSPSMGVYNAWDQGYTGNGITIAFLDDGLDTDHSDIANNYNSARSYDYIYDVSDPSHVAGDTGHGTSCAGIAAGVKNTACAIGIAYDATIVAVKILDATYGLTESGQASAVMHELSNIHIYSNSWGPSDGGNVFSGPGSVTQAALLQGVTDGRGGLGAIYTWAAGNGGDNSDDCNCDGFANSIYTIATTSVSQDLGPSFYSETCSSVLVSTYSGDSVDNTDAVVTANRDGACRTDFQGTSASCPMASGIIALVLQANPSLTWRDIQHMIVESSVKTGLTGGNFATNGAGKLVSHKFGFGLMNAENMLTLAADWTTVGTMMSCNSGTRSVSSTSTTGSPIVTTYDLTGCSFNYTEHVTVEIDFQSDRRGRTEIYLISPSGTSSKLLHERSPDTSSSSTDWTFMSVHCWGEDPAGTWTLRMETTDSSIDMTLTSWKMTVYGTTLGAVTTPFNTGTPNNDSGDSDDTGTIAGATVGGVVVVAGCIIAAVIFKLVKSGANTQVVPSGN